MTQLLIYERDGTQRTGSTLDSQMVSKIEGMEATETWQVGYVNDKLAIRVKSVSAVNALLRRANDGDLVEVTYKARLGVKEGRETLIVRHVGFARAPMLVGTDTRPLSDADVVFMLESKWGEYLTVTYRLISNQASESLPQESRSIIPWPLKKPELAVL